MDRPMRNAALLPGIFSQIDKAPPDPSMSSKVLSYFPWNSVL